MNTSFGQTHGDLLLSRVHKHNSLEYLQPMKGSRPGSAASRPRSAASSKGAGRSSRPASAVPKSMASAAPSYNSITSLRSSVVKTDLQKAIDGDTGPAMIGVASYPYSATQKNYLDDFEMLVAGTITHPYVCSTSSNKGSSPHNLLTGAQPQSPALGVAVVASPPDRPFGQRSRLTLPCVCNAPQAPTTPRPLTTSRAKVRALSRRRATKTRSKSRRSASGRRRCSPWARRRHSPFTIHHSPFTIHHSPCIPRLIQTASSEGCDEELSFATRERYCGHVGMHVWGSARGWSRSELVFNPWVSSVGSSPNNKRSLHLK